MAWCRGLVAAVAPILAAILLFVAPVVASLLKPLLPPSCVLANDTLAQWLRGNTHQRSPCLSLPTTSAGWTYFASFETRRHPPDG
jgi:hypothetical protein